MVYYSDLVKSALNRAFGDITKSKEGGKVKLARILIIAGDATATSHLVYAVPRLQEEGFDVTVAAPIKKRLNTV